MIKKILIGLGIFFVVMIVIGMATGNSTNTTSTNNTSSDSQKSSNTQAKKEDTNKEYAVGETVKMNDWELTVNEVTKAKSKGYSTAKSGKEYVFVNATLKNVGKGEAKGTGSLDFKVQDSNGVQVDRTYVTLDDEMQGFVDLASGGTLTGTIPFEVPENDQNLKLIFQPNYWLDSQRIIVKLQ